LEISAPGIPGRPEPVVGLSWQHEIGLATRWYPSIRIMLKSLETQVPDQETPGADRLATEIINLCVDSNVDISDTSRTANVIKSFPRKIRMRLLLRGPLLNGRVLI